MDAHALDIAPAAPLRTYWVETRNECMRVARTPMFLMPTLLFPAMFYLLFAVALHRGDSGGAAMSLHMLASYGVFGVMAPGLFGFGVSVALDRERGWLDLRRALPAPPGAYLIAKLAMAMGFAALIFTLLGVLAFAASGVRLPAANWAALFVVEIFGVLPFCAIGLFIGTHVGGQGAPAVANLVYLPMSFLSGLWMPLALLPESLRAIAPLWPSFHLSQLALAAVGQPSTGTGSVHVAVLLAFTVGFFALARARLARGRA